MPYNTEDACFKTGAIAMPDKYSAATAQEVLGLGGNAVDAAIAAAFTLAVTYPEAGNIGGGGFMTLYFENKPYFLDYRERAPASAKEDMYLDMDGNVVPGLSVVGNLSVGVPGTVEGLWQAHLRFGTLPWVQLVEPAIRYAKNGFTVARHLSDRRDVMLDDFKGKTNFTEYFGDMDEGKVFRQPELAWALHHIALNGARGFYSGRIAELLVAKMEAEGGLITREDLKAYSAVWREPLQAKYNGHQVITAPPPSSGGIGLIQHLKMKEIIEEEFAGLPLNSPQYVHLLAEIAKRVFSDRAEYLGDPDFQKMPVDYLISDYYLRRRVTEIDRKRPTRIEKIASLPLEKLELIESDETTHFSIVDKWGNAVSNTFTLNSKFGSGVVVDGAGFLLNNGMDDFSSKAGVANRFGLIGNGMNAVAPYKRMVSSMTPTILTKEGKVSLVIGTPGGSRIFTSMFQVINNLFHFKLTPYDSVAEMRVHHQLFPIDTILYEPYKPIEGELAEKLESLGYTLMARYTNGDMQVILAVGDNLVPASDPRARGISMVV